MFQENHSGVIEEEELADCELTDVLSDGEAQDSDDGPVDDFRESTESSKVCYVSLISEN